jgi:HEAT repeat protein
VLVAGVFAMLYATREPSADGRTLSEWLRLVRKNYAQRDNTDATNAVRAIGAKAVPILIEKLRKTDPAWKIRVYNEWSRKIFDDEWVFAARYEAYEGVLGFSIVGTQAVAAIPELSKMLFDTNNDTRVGEALGYVVQTR